MRRALRLLMSVGMIVALTVPATGHAGGWSIIDRRIHKEDSGIWDSKVYRGMMGALAVGEIGGALWEGSESRLGKTLWQSVDAQLLAAGSTTVLKYAFTRERPSETDNPNEWFSGGSNYSFPSTETAFAAALVTPLVLEYGSERPSIYGLLLLPLYVGVGRVKNQEHWQSDVLAGWAIGALSGWYAHRRETPILVQILPHGVVVGLKTRF